MKSFRIFVLSVLVVALLIGVMGRVHTAVAQQEDRKDWPSNFLVGIFAGEDSTKALTGAEPLRSYLEAKLKMRVVMYTGSSYTAVIQAMKAGRVDAFEVGPFAYILAVQEANAEALAVNATESRSADRKYNPDTFPYYFSVIITKKGSGIEKLDDLKGKSFSFVDPASTSGHLMPRTRIIKAGIDVEKDMKPIFAGSHPTSVQAVATDKVQAGATFLTNLERMVNEKQVDFCWFSDGDFVKERTQKELDDLRATCKDGQIVVIAMSDPIPNTPFAINKNLPETFKKAVKDALLSVKDNPEIVKGLGGWYVDPTEKLKDMKSVDGFYDGLREVAKLLNLELKSLVK
jgi:phosphonate transport system substrate-binding protein